MRRGLVVRHDPEGTAVVVALVVVVRLQPCRGLQALGAVGAPLADALAACHGEQGWYAGHFWQLDKLMPLGVFEGAPGRCAVDCQLRLGGGVLPLDVLAGACLPANCACWDRLPEPRASEFALSMFHFYCLLYSAAL